MSNRLTIDLLADDFYGKAQFQGFRQVKSEVLLGSAVLVALDFATIYKHTVNVPGFGSHMRSVFVPLLKGIQLKKQTNAALSEQDISLIDFLFEQAIDSFTAAAETLSDKHGEHQVYTVLAAELRLNFKVVQMIHPGKVVEFKQPNAFFSLYVLETNEYYVFLYPHSQFALTAWKYEEPAFDSRQYLEECQQALDELAGIEDRLNSLCATTKNKLNAVMQQLTQVADPSKPDYAENCRKLQSLLRQLKGVPNFTLPLFNLDLERLFTINWPNCPEPARPARRILPNLKRCILCYCLPASTSGNRWHCGCEVCDSCASDHRECPSCGQVPTHTPTPAKYSLINQLGNCSQCRKRTSLACECSCSDCAVIYFSPETNTCSSCHTRFTTDFVEYARRNFVICVTCHVPSLAGYRFQCGCVFCFECLKDSYQGHFVRCPGCGAGVTEDSLEQLYQTLLKHFPSLVRSMPRCYQCNRLQNLVCRCSCAFCANRDTTTCLVCLEPYRAL